MAALLRQSLSLILLLFCIQAFLFGCGNDPSTSSGQATANDDDSGTPDDDDSAADDDNDPGSGPGQASDDDDDDDDDDDNNDDDNDGEDWKFIKDEEGGALIFHGCNLDGAAKWNNGLPTFTEEEVLAMGSEWGFNFARYLIFWAAIEPDAMGEYDEDYLDAVEERLDWAHDAGLTVVLDMHQDVWGPFVANSSGFDGAPEWATITDGWPHIPFSQYFGGWAFDYLSPEVIRAFDNFWAYDRHPELQDAYGAMWAHVAARFKDHPAVLGYDIMNEPFQGLGILHYREFDQTLYGDFNQRIINAIRQADLDGWIFYEPCAFAANQGIPAFLPVLNDPRAGEQRLAYFPHIYPVLVELEGGYYPGLDQTLNRWERARLKESASQKAPLLSGEWAMLQYFDEENRVLWYDEALRMLERSTSGWAHWDCGWLKNSTDKAYFPMVTGTYPRRVAGHPTAYSYDEATRTFTLVFEQRDGVTGNTEIFLPADRDYPAGWALECSDPAGTWSYDYDETTRVLSIATNPEMAEHTITIFPAEL